MTERDTDSHLPNFSAFDYTGSLRDTCRMTDNSACFPSISLPDDEVILAKDWTSRGIQTFGYPEDALPAVSADASGMYEWSTVATATTTTTPSMRGCSNGRETDVGDAGGLRIDVDSDGKFIRLTNDSSYQDEELGCCIIRQAFQGHAIIEFHFPPRVSFPAGASITVWSTGKDPKDGQPPDGKPEKPPQRNFYFKELFRWASGPNNLTTLVRPNGQFMTSTESYSSYSLSSSFDRGFDRRIISKYNLISNRFKKKYDEEKALSGIDNIDLMALLTKNPVSRFQPRIIRRDGIEAKPKDGNVRRKFSSTSSAAFPGL